MKSNLTTGQMIDELQKGEIAVGMNGFLEKTRLKRTDYDEIIYVDGDIGSNNDFFKLNTFAHSTRWKIRKAVKGE